MRSWNPQRAGLLASVAFLSLMLPTTAAAQLTAAVLPSSRSIQVGSTATAFATVINGGTTTAVGCTIGAPANMPAVFFFQTTNPATNQVTGAVNAAVNIAAGSVQTFVIAFTATTAFGPIDVPLSFSCGNTGAAPVISGVNTLLLSASFGSVPDAVALAATLNNDGVVRVPVTGIGVFAVATVNVGGSALVTITADTGSAALPVIVGICQTDSAGRCTSPVSSALDGVLNAGGTATFGVFVSASAPIAFNPAVNRVFIRVKDGSVTRGSTSVAVQAAAAP